MHYKICKSCQKYAVVKSLYYTYFCKNIETQNKSKVFIDRKSKIHFGKNSIITIENGSLIIDRSSVDFMIPSNIFLSENSSWLLHGSANIAGGSISIWNTGELITGNSFVVNPLTRIMVEKKYLLAITT